MRERIIVPAAMLAITVVAGMAPSQAAAQDYFYRGKPAPIIESAAPLSLSAPGSVALDRGRAADVALVANGGTGRDRLFSATGLPAGLSIDTATGRITGMTTATGSVTVVVTVA